MEIDAPAGADDAAAAATFARSHLLDPVAVRAPFFGVEAARQREAAAGLTDVDPTLLEQARRELSAAIEVAARFGAPRVVVDPGLLPVEESARSAAVERVCRELWEVLRAEDGLRLVVTHRADSERGFGLRELSWLLGEFEPRTLGFGFDLGVVGRLEQAGGDSLDDWEDALGERIELIYLSDATDVEDGLPIGAGRIEPARMQRLLQREVPTVLKLSEGIPRLMVEESLRQLRQGAR